MNVEHAACDIINGDFEYMLVYEYGMGYCYMAKQNGFWEQCTKWYQYYGNLKRFNRGLADKTMFYKVVL